MILPVAFYPFGVYLAYIYFATAVPRELLEAARIDGAGEWQVFRSVAIPLATPIILLVCVLRLLRELEQLLPALRHTRDSSAVATSRSAWTSCSRARPAFNPGTGRRISWRSRDLELALATMIAAAPVLIVLIVVQRSLVRRTDARSDGRRTMRIVEVEAYPVRGPVPEPVSLAGGSAGERQIRSSKRWSARHQRTNGVEGYGSIDRADHRPRPASNGSCARSCSGSIRCRRSSLAPVWELDRIEELPIYALGAVDVALWDITAKVAGLPLYQVLGGYRDAIPAYASTVTFATTEEFLDVADQCLEYGFTGDQAARLGRRPTRRQALPGPARARRRRDRADVRRLGRLRPVDALYVGRALEEAGYLWYEEPMREFSIERLPAALRRAGHPAARRPRPPTARTTTSPTSSSTARPTWSAPARTTRAASPAGCASRTWPTPSTCAPRSTAAGSRTCTSPARSRTPPTTSRCRLAIRSRSTRASIAMASSARRRRPGVGYEIDLERLRRGELAGMI